VETGGGRLLGDELQPALGHRGQIVTDLLEGGLGNPADDQLVLVLRENARQLPERVDVGDHEPSPKRGCQDVGEDERIDGTR
jgi:hypothetical protein